MGTYVGLFILLLFSLLYKKGESWMAYFAWLMLFLSTVLRAESIGADTYTYLNSFTEDSRILEYFTTFIYSIVLSKNLDTRWILVIFGIVTYLPLPFIAKRFKLPLSYFLLFFFLFFHYYGGLNIMRNMAATSLVVLGITYIYEKNRLLSLLFFVFVLIAAGFHTTSYIFLPLYLIRFARIKKVYAIIAIISFSLLLMAGIIPINSIINKYTPEVYQEYEWRIMASLETSSLGILVGLMVLFAYSLLVEALDKTYTFLYAISIIAVYSAFGSDANVFRALQPLLLCRTIFIAKIAYNNQLNGPQQIALVFIVAYAALTCYTGFAGDPTVTPYHTMFY